MFRKKHGIACGCDKSGNNIADGKYALLCSEIAGLDCTHYLFKYKNIIYNPIIQNQFLYFRENYQCRIYGARKPVYSGLYMATIIQKGHLIKNTLDSWYLSPY